MTPFRAVIMILVALVTIGILVYWIAPKLERYEDERLVDVSAEAKRNRFLAMERFLRRSGHELEATEQAETLIDLPPPSDTIIASYSEEILTDERLYELEEWVSQGGHLILEVDVYRWSGTDFIELPLLFALDAEAIPKERLVPHDEKQPSVVTRDSDAEPWRLDVPRGFVLRDLNGEARAWRGEEGAHALEYSLEQGRFTVVSDRELWNNNAIGEHDHAAYLAALVGPNPGKIWLLRNLAFAPLWKLLWNNAWQCIVALAVALLLGLWAMDNRFGPLLPRSDLRRRSLLEHFDAAARFAWRHGRGVALVNATRRELRHRIERVHPGWQHKPHDEKIDWIAARVKREPDAIRRALDGPVAEVQQMIDTVSLLQLIRKSL